MSENTTNPASTDEPTEKQTEKNPDLTEKEVLTILDKECDGKPHLLLRHNGAKRALAYWKANPVETEFAFEAVNDAIKWRGVEMAKSDFQAALARIGSEQAATGDSESRSEIEVSEVTAEKYGSSLDLSDMLDRQRVNRAYQWISANLDVVAIEEEGQDGDILHYDHGIWRPNGEIHVARAVNDILGEYSTGHISKEVQNQYVKVESESNITSDALGLGDGRVAVANGLLNLRTGEIERGLQPEDYAITMVPHEYHPDAECPTWERFISESVENEKQDLVQEYVGYTLLRGEYPYAKALMLLGDGQNGKTTFLNTVEKLLGSEENVMNADLSELAGSRFSAYRLEGKLANINADIENGEIQNISMFKNAVGGDSFQVEQKYGDPYDHKNSAKMIFASNSIPSVDTDELAFYRRWLLVQFPHSFTQEEDDGNPPADPDLPAKLDTEMEGILAWAVEGIQRLMANDGQFTNALTHADVRDQWYSYSDPLAEFVTEWLIHDQSESPTPTAEIYDAYERFMQHQPSSPVTHSQLTQYIKREFEDGGKHGTKKSKDRESFKGFGSVHLHPDRR